MLKKLSFTTVIKIIWLKFYLVKLKAPRIKEKEKENFNQKWKISSEVNLETISKNFIEKDRPNLYALILSNSLFNSYLLAYKFYLI